MSLNLEDVNLDSKEGSIDASRTSPPPKEGLEMEADTMDSSKDGPIEENSVEIEGNTVDSGSDNATNTESEDKNEDIGENAEGIPPLPARKSFTHTENPILVELKGAFPNIEEKYIKAVLIASQGQMDPAFNALLFLSDPDFEKEAAIPTEATATDTSSRRRLTQLEQDELLARQLDEKFNKHGTENAERHARERRIRQRQADYERRYGSGNPERYLDGENENYEDDEDAFSNFVDKELPQIRDNLNRNIQETGKKISTWFTGFKKSIIDERDDQEYGGNYRAPGNSRFNSFGNRYDDSKAEPSSKLETAGISLRNEDLDFESDEDIPPQLPTRAKKVVAETTFIDTPEPKRNMQTISPKPDTSPTKPNSKAVAAADELDEMFADTE